MRTSNRRQFLTAGLGVGTIAAISATDAEGIEPIRRGGCPRVRLSLAAYSYRSYLNLRRRPRPTMDLADFISDAARMPLDAVELTSYYAPSTTTAYLTGLKRQCIRLGLDVSGTAVRNDFCSSDRQQRQRDIQHVKNWIEHTSLLGGKTIRIFAGNVPRGEAVARARTRCVEGIQEVCDHAGGFGVYVALENHGGITASSDEMLAIVRAVRHDWFGVNLDTGNFRTADPYSDLEKIAPYAVNVQLKTEIQRAGRAKEDADIPRLLGILKRSSYRGYLVLEYEASGEPREEVPRELARLERLVQRADLR